MKTCRKTTFEAWDGPFCSEHDISWDGLSWDGAVPVINASTTRIPFLQNSTPPRNHGLVGDWKTSLRPSIYLYGLNEEWNDFFVASVVFQNNFLRPPKYPMCIAEFTMFMNCSPARDDVHIKIIANLRYAGKN